MEVLPVHAVNYDAGHDNINFIICYHLAHYDDEERCLGAFLNMMSGNNHYQIMENRIIIPTIKDFLAKAKWKKKRDSSCGDYNPFEPESWLNVIYRRYEVMYSAIRNAENMINTWPSMKDASILEIVGGADPEITQDVIDNKEELPKHAERMKKKVKEASSPLEVINLIEESWDFTYNTSAIYHALEYCILASENHSVYPDFKTDIRNLGYTLAPIYVSIDGKKKAAYDNIYSPDNRQEFT